MRTYQFGQAPGASRGVIFSTGFFGGFVFDDPKWDFRAFDVARDLPLAREKLSATLDATNADLRAFEKRGGKLLQYHGWLDGSIPAQASMRYYDRVTQMMGGVKRTQRFYRLFLAPGVLHCGWGPGPNAFGNLGAPAARDPDHDVLLALDRWVESGKAPDRIIATKYRDDDPAKGIVMQRPLCPYPLEARWDRKGDPALPGSFRCAKKG